MHSKTFLRCLFCAQEHPIDSGAMRCGREGCSGLLEVAFNHFDTLERAVAEDRKKDFRRRRLSDAPADASGIWRFREYVLPHLDPSRLVTRGSAEGNTPLLRFVRSAAFAGCEDVQFKHEGCNATGSFKDRGMTAGVSAAVQQGAKMLACASTGNTAASMASYAALAGLPALILLPDGAVSMGKISQSLAYGAKVVMVRGSFDTALRLLQSARERFGFSVMNSLNPLRLEGQKTIIWEMLEQRGWNPPDWIVVPGGNLGNAAAFHKALAEAVRCGWIRKMPRLAIIQADGAAPLARAWPELRKMLAGVYDVMQVFETEDGERIAAELRRGQCGFRAVDAPETVATAIRIGAPVNFPKAVRALFDTDGECVSVPDEAILEAKLVLDSDGIGAEPSSATALAGLRALRKSGVVGAKESVAVVLTGHVLKAADHIVESMRHPDGPTRLKNAPTVIDADLDALSRIIDISQE